MITHPVSSVHTSSPMAPKLSLMKTQMNHLIHELATIKTNIEKMEAEKEELRVQVGDSV